MLKNHFVELNRFLSLVNNSPEMTFNYSLCTLVLFCLMFSNCETEIKRETETSTTSSDSTNKKETSKQKITVPKFDADSAFFS